MHSGLCHASKSIKRPFLIPVTLQNFLLFCFYFFPLLNDSIHLIALPFCVHLIAPAPAVLGWEPRQHVPCHMTPLSDLSTGIISCCCSCQTAHLWPVGTMQQHCLHEAAGTLIVVSSLAPGRAASGIYTLLLFEISLQA